MGVIAASHLMDPEAALLLAERIARLTHDTSVVIDTCRYVTALLIGALQGARADELLEPDFCPLPGLWTKYPLTPELAAVLAENPAQERSPSQWAALAGGNIMDSLRVLRWSLGKGRNFRETVLSAVNLGQDADINGALVGQLAGALYGYSSIPSHWAATVMQRERISAVADRLLLSGLTSPTDRLNGLIISDVTASSL
jgi:ADP-ribosylglycohydrolase